MPTRAGSAEPTEAWRVPLRRDAQRDPAGHKQLIDPDR
jgi:hypothetical protein